MYYDVRKVTCTTTPYTNVGSKKRSYLIKFCIRETIFPAVTNYVFKRLLITKNTKNYF